MVGSIRFMGAGVEVVRVAGTKTAGWSVFTTGRGLVSKLGTLCAERDMEPISHGTHSHTDF